MKITYFFSWIL